MSKVLYTIWIILILLVSGWYVKSYYFDSCKAFNRGVLSITYLPGRCNTHE